MANLLIAFSPLLILIIILSFVSAIVSFVIAISQGGKRNFLFRENKTVYISIAILVSGLLMIKVMTLLATNEFKNILRTKFSLEIMIDGRVIEGEEKNMFIKDSLNIYTHKGRSGSHPVRVQKVSLTTKEAIHTYFYQQDSRDSRMYWIYLPSELIKMKIGFVETSVINQAT